MNDEDLAFAPISVVAPLLRSGATTSRALTEIMLARIAKFEPALNAYITVTADRARDRAARADAELKAGDDRGPLHGIPIAIKDLIATKGVRTTAGTLHYKDWVPDHDATVVRKLADAGAVCLGKAGLHELAYGSTSNNPHYGAIVNPWKAGYHPGGSSGGSAVAVAAGLAYAALGTDTGCSVRMPAHCCGIVGHKPTFGLVSNVGVVPLVSSMDHVGPMTRSVRDAALLLRAIGGPDSDDPVSAMRDVGDPSARLGEGLAGVRLGVPRGWFYEGGDTEVIALVDAAVGVLRDLGAAVVEVELADLKAAYRANVLMFAEVAAAHGEKIAENPDGFSDIVRQSIERDGRISAVDYIKALEGRRAFCRDVDVVMADIDALVTPTSTVTAAPIAEQPADHVRERWKNAGLFNLTGQPSISVPCGRTRAGLPAGLMITGRRFEDDRVLQIADAYEQATDWHGLRPPL